MSMRAASASSPVSVPVLDASIPSPFSVCSWNACSLLARAPSVQLFLLQHRPSILIIIEPMITDASRIPSFPYYSAVHIPHPSHHTHGGLVLYMHSSITYQQHTTAPPSFTHHTASTTAIFHISSPILPRPFILVPLYASCHTSAEDWHDMMRFFSAAPSSFTPHHDKPTLIIGDMNARHPTWDNTHDASHINSSGTRLHAFLSQDTDWHLLNIMQPHIQHTHFPRTPHAKPSVIDLALSNDYNLVSSFDVHTDGELLSDHAPIITTLHSHAHSSTSTSCRCIWNTSKQDIAWDVFQSMLIVPLSGWRNKWSLNRQWPFLYV